MEILNKSWQEKLSGEFDKEYYHKLMEFLDDEYKTKEIYPAKEDVFNALNYSDFNDVKVVILGQDPYHGKGQAHGLSFSVNKDIKTPKSLVNIYKELNDDLGCHVANNGYLKKWADQGVLLLNTVFTVRAGLANSHRKQGWEIFSDLIISKLNERSKPIIFILWGKNAQSKEKLIRNENHFIISSVHPSPLSSYRGFFGSKPFSKTNEILISLGEKAIDWQIEDI
ncbi:MAG: uracil-DNA glycosylase [Acidaminobacteraceae bacterium]